MADLALGARRDFVRNRWASLLIWGVPSLVMIATGPWVLTAPIQGLIWTACLSVLGLGCIANARRCGRLHCYFTGPFFLTMAALSSLYGFGVVSLGGVGWGWIGGVTLVGAIALTILPERIWGVYVGRGSR